MTGPQDVSLRWDHGGVEGLVTSAYARITLTSPIADPSEVPNVISLDINLDGDGFRWSDYHGGEEDAPFNEGIKSGSAADLETAKRDAWEAVFHYLTNLGFTNGEITESISQPAGSLTLDLDEGDDDDE
jgi:hypothetical protein